MPFFKINHQLVYYAHVPKCGGSSIANYLRDRFGPLAFYNTDFHKTPEALRWTRSSPQHVDAGAMGALIPPSYFAAMFAFVRHPVARVVSSYHFQAEVEQVLEDGIGFSDWLQSIAVPDPDQPFAFDNHIRPMSDIVPEGATVFHLEYGADQLVPWLDALAGGPDGARAIPPENVRGQHVQTSGGKVTPTADDLALIARIYAEDFRRFGYVPENRAPLAEAPRIDAEFLAERDRALRAATHPVNRLKRRIRDKFRQV